jgi:hypothetical protein
MDRPDQTLADLPQWPNTSFSGPTAFAQFVRDGLAQAAHAGCMQLVLSDADFEDWPLRERAVVESLQEWSRSGRKMVVLARSYDAIVRLHPRFVAWRVMWDHIVECRMCKSLDASEFPSMLWTPNWVLHRMDAVRSVGVCTTEPQRRLKLKEALDECVRQSSPGFPASILGL